MHMTSKPDDAQKRSETMPGQGPQRSPGQGKPSTHTALSVRKDVTVRVSVARSQGAEGDELKEDGYGHGV
ncbi:MAG TPA: hypothetical protein VNJ02_20325 [Vicinamibacterales bacterium]|nr:hypothetical protein [Vicinamibacterales bacterium]